VQISLRHAYFSPDSMCWFVTVFVTMLIFKLILIQKSIFAYVGSYNANSATVEMVPTAAKHPVFLLIQTSECPSA
jgi:hypothetical protein